MRREPRPGALSLVLVPSELWLTYHPPPSVPEDPQGPTAFQKGLLLALRSQPRGALGASLRPGQEKYMKLAYQPKELFMGWEAHKK